MKTKHLFTIWLFSYIHAKGWCESWHRNKNAQMLGYGECFLVDQILLILHPKFIAKDLLTPTQ